MLKFQFRKVGFFVLGLLLFLGQYSVAEAATLVTAGDVFEKPSLASKKLKSLPEGTKVHVTGDVSDDSGMVWNSIEIGKEPHVERGWVNANNLAIEAGDAGFIVPIGFREQLRFFLGAGMGTITSNENYFTGRLSAGIDYLFDQSQSVVEFMIAKPISRENFSSGVYEGGLHRLYFMPGYGYYLIPERLLLRGSVGLGYLSGDSANIDAKLKPVLGAGLRYLVDINGAYGMGLELAYEYSGTAYKPISDPSGIVNSLNCANIPSSSGCSTPEPGTIPQASIWTMNVLFTFH